MKFIIKRLSALMLALSLLASVTACSVKITSGDKSESQSQSNVSQSHSEKNSASSADNETSNSTNSSIQGVDSGNSSLESSSSSSIHVHDYNLKIVGEEQTVKAPTLLENGEYYLTCECGKISDSDTFLVQPLDYDYAKIDSYIDYLLTNGGYGNPIWNTENPDSTTWNYIDGCLMISLMKMYYCTNEEKYLNFVKDYVSPQINSDGSIKTYSKGDYNLDNINEGRVLFDLYNITNEEKYRKAIDTLYAQLEEQPRTSLNSFWHKKKYTNQVWLDGLYMAQVFYTKYLQNYADGDYSDVMNQYLNVEKYMKDKTTGLYYHGFDVTKTQSWADKETGLSKSFWLRAIGWYIASLSDVGALLPENSSEKKTIQGYLQNAIDSMLNYLDKDKKMFYQVVDKQGQTATKGTTTKENYLETSGTALICYAILNAVNNGLIDETYYNVGKSIFNGICCEKLTVTDSKFTLSGICKVGGLGGTSNGVSRDGSFYYYLSESVVSNEAKGVAPFIMAYVELQKYKTANQ